MSNQKPIKIQLKLGGGKDSIIPNGVMESLLIEVIDGYASFHFQNSATTMAFAEGQNKDGVTTIFNERLSKAICEYPKMSQKEITEHIQLRLTRMGAKWPKNKEIK